MEVDEIFTPLTIRNILVPSTYILIIAPPVPPLIVTADPIKPETLLNNCIFVLTPSNVTFP